MNVPRWHTASPLRALLMLTAAILVLAACGSGSSGSASPVGAQSSDSAVPGASAGMVEVTVNVRAGRVAPAPQRVVVQPGQAVRLVVSSDVPDQVHVHGIEILTDVSPGRQTVISFVADAPPGLLDVELEQLGVRLLQLEMR
jgi:ABC-type Fe3+-hydroxamate transport system substrate-binding protein